MYVKEVPIWGSRCGKKRMKKTARDGMTMAVYEEVIAISF